MNLTDIIKKLCAADGISGTEKSACAVALQLIKPFAQNAYIDDFNNVIAVIREPKAGEKSVLFDAHIDQIGLIVTAIDKDGFLHVDKCGGVDRRLLLGQRVRVLTDSGEIYGTIAENSPADCDTPKVPEFDDVLIDIAMPHDSAVSAVSLGDRIIIDSQFHELLGNRISSMALDDRSGVAAIIHAVEKISKSELHCGLTVLFSSQEEIGENGAKIAGYNLNPDIAIAVDVSFARTPDADEFKCGVMGKGAMIGIAPTLDNALSKTLLDIAITHSIPYQDEVMSGSTGTNADALGLGHGGAKTGVIGIPEKYMHTPIEVVDITDLEYVSDMMALYALSFDEKNDGTLFRADTATATQISEEKSELSMLQKLSDLNGISGYEDDVRNFIIEQIKYYCEYKTDNLGNLICTAKSSNPTVIITAPMDEVGLIITGITSDGLLKFASIGEIDDRVVLGRAVNIFGENGKILTGVIGTKAIHQQSPDERKTVVKLDKMFIDIGANDKAQALCAVHLGAVATFDCNSKKLHDDRIMGKALGSRAACSVLIDVIKSGISPNIACVFTVQSLLSARGAITAANTISPKTAIVLTPTLARDVGAKSPENAVCELDKGAVLNVMDTRVIYNKELFTSAKKLADSLKIPVQNKTKLTLSAEAAAISVSAHGVKTIAVGIPYRYAGTANTMLSQHDVDAVKNLAMAIIREVTHA